MKPPLLERKQTQSSGELIRAHHTVTRSREKQETQEEEGKEEDKVGEDERTTHR
jgi:hypothetical protein